MKVRIRPLRLLVAWVLSAIGLLIAALIVPHVDGRRLLRRTASPTAVIAMLNAILPPLLAALRLPFMLAPASCSCSSPTR